MDRIRRLVGALIAWFVARIHSLGQRIREARAPQKALPFDPNHVPVYVPPEAGPLVESPVSKDPLLLTQLPIQSSKAAAKKDAHRYAERRVGRPLSWKKARALMAKWEREERAVERSMAPEYAERMQNLTEAAK